MANRTALRELQTRLATRLQAARTEGVAASWLAVEASGTRYLLPLSQAGEIFPFAQIQAVPYTQRWFMGVANLRGGLYGVVDLASFVTGAMPLARPESVRNEARLVALNSLLEINCALLIDRLAGLRNVDAFASSAPPHEGAPPWFGSGYTDPTGTRWQELDLQALSRQAEFLSISA